ncbi:SEL1-like repeat protein [Blastochloris viridis]|uniref:Sel1 repeat n=1 Tax=Blastochloris viridis TaxID=1079 RepID=A0A0H5BPJ8_BLAVI|nr:SEL1-like repeat protein [Blastochloris viridis]ALK10630.1 Sel1 repeat protein [Blastochloris viridis]BAR99413.1 TPR repeat-containing protein [Blastochloris viridis]CUU43293.1 Sel1 repeat [Blastochloris viridis]
MARYEIAELETAAIAAGQASGDIFYRLGLMYSTGASVKTDRVTAHKWFNLAAMRGNGEAARLRRELAAEMTDAEIATALRAAREWAKTH